MMRENNSRETTNTNIKKNWKNNNNNKNNPNFKSELLESR
jgi:hypothetical protein